MAYPKQWAQSAQTSLAADFSQRETLENWIKGA